MAFGGRSQLKMSEETFDFVCTACTKKGKIVEAVKYCVECSGYCCQSCTDIHTLFPTLENHSLMEVNQGNRASGQSASLPEFPTERCSKHKGKVMDMYCESHDDVGCSTCFVKDHKSCQDSHIHSIPDMIDTIFKLSDCKQTHRLLKEKMASVNTVCESNDTQLQTLERAKNKALDQVTTYQKALEAILINAAERSRQKVQDAYKELKKDILQEKHIAKNMCEDMQTTDEKLNQSEGNRAQRFVCTKIAEELMKSAESEKMKPGLKRNTDVHISFTPDGELMKYINSLQGIGQVQKYRQQQYTFSKAQKHDLYKIKGNKDISIKLSDDSSTCYSFGCCPTDDNQLLVTDRDNKKLKRVDIQKMSVVDFCTLDSQPYGVCCISKHEAAVACMSNNKIQFVSTILNKMTPTRQITMSHQCYGITFNDDKLYVTDEEKSLHVYAVNGTLLQTISHDNTGKNLFNFSRHVTFNANGNRMFVVCGLSEVICFDRIGNYLSTITDKDLDSTHGVCIDGRGNVFVVGRHSHNVEQFSEEGKKIGVVVKKGDGLEYPTSVCFHQRLNRLFVTMFDSDVVKMCELE